MRSLCVPITFLALALASIAAAEGIDWKKQDGRWSIEQAKAWDAKIGWIIGADFVPSTASNQLEMWQEATFDPGTIDRELGWAAGIGFNAMRVYLHDMAWKADPAGFEARMAKYLDIAGKHGIRTLFVLFDSVWDPRPALGPQKEPTPGVHNSRWVQSPHIDIQKDPARHEEVKPFVLAVVSRFKDDDRILGWDVLNEPGNHAQDYDEGWSAADKEAAHAIFLPKLFAWAREAGPSQPLTAGPWINPGGRTNPVNVLDKIMLEHSDIISFHCYTPLPGMKKAVEWLEQSGRPIWCTEYMARGNGSTFQAILPYLHEKKIGAINWGLVDGRSQTIYPWSSWKKPVKGEPDPWFHDVFRRDGTPYSAEEMMLIKSLTGK